MPPDPSELLRDFENGYVLHIIDEAIEKASIVRERYGKLNDIDARLYDEMIDRLVSMRMGFTQRAPALARLIADQMEQAA